MQLVEKLTHLIGVGETTAEGQERYDSTRKAHRYHDGVRERAVSAMGYQPYAFTIGLGPSSVVTTTIPVAAGGEALTVPVIVKGHMLVQGYSWWDTKVNGQNTGPVFISLYEDRLNNSGTIDQVSGSTSTLAAYSDTTVAKVRTVDLDSPPLYLPPGIYWLVAKNDHAANNNAVGGLAAGTIGINVVQQKILSTGALPSTLDMTTGWTKTAVMPSYRLNGRVFGQTTAF